MVFHFEGKVHVLWICLKQQNVTFVGPVTVKMPK